MEFSEFVSRLHSVVGSGNSTHSFTKSILDAVTIDCEEVDDILDSYSEDTYKAYFNGNTKVTKIANKLSAYLEPFEFTSYLEKFSDFTTESLCEVFADFLPKSTPHTVVSDISDLLVSIIRTAASGKRKPAAKPPVKEKEPKTDEEIITDALSKGVQTFADALKANTHQVADQIRANNKKTGSPEDEPESVEAEVVDDEMPSGAAEEEDKRITVIKQQTNVIQNGDNNVNVTNNGTMNFNF